MTMPGHARLLRLVELTKKGHMEEFTMEDMETIKSDVSALFTHEVRDLVSVLMDQILVLKSRT